MELPRIRLSRLQIVGLALSVAWALIAGAYTHYSDGERAAQQADFSYHVCINGKIINKSTETESCNRQRDGTFAIFMDGDLGNSLFAALAPLPFFWFAAFCLYYVVKAQIIGFRTAIPWRELTRPKKTVVVLCFIGVLGAGYMGLLFLLNAYVDSIVPIVPSLKSFVTLPGGEEVVVTGTWTRTDLIDDTIADPIQTSQISCFKREFRCTEAKGEIGLNQLMITSWDHEIKNWTESQIVLEDDDTCATEIFTIDLKTEVVSGVGYKTHKGESYCQTSWQQGPDRWTYLMEDGFKVYWNQRQKARPLLLRLMHTLAGN